MLKRKINGESVERTVRRSNGSTIRIIITRYIMDPEIRPEEKYCYIHVYRGPSNFPFRWWRWIEFTDGTWKWAP